MSSLSERRWRRGLEDEGEQLTKLGCEATIMAQKESLFQVFGIDVNGSFFMGKNVLEIGCSPFALIHGIPDFCFKIGIDPLASSDRFKRFYRDNNVCHITGMAEQLPFRDDSYDVVICVNGPDHWLNPGLGLKEIWRVCRKGGLVLLMTHSFSLPRKVLPLLVYFDQHPQHFGSNDVLSLIKASGLEVRYARSRRIPLVIMVSLLRKGLVKSSLKTLFAILLQIHDSAYLLAKATS